MDAFSRLVTIGALFGWIPLVLVLFTLMPVRRAVVASATGAWLLLPPIGIDLPGLPVYDKAAAATVGIMVATVLFQPHRLMGFRLRWFDLPMVAWCICPFFSSVLNDLGTYDGMSMVVRQLSSWFFPYLVGRLYLTDCEGLGELAQAMVVAGVCLIPFCFLEIRLSPVMSKWVYGFGGQGAFEGTRYGFYRPRVFFGSGLELGLWMNAVSLVGWWLWRTGQLNRWWPGSGGIICAALLFTTVACRSTGATALLLGGMTALWICHRTGTKWAMWALLMAAPLYCFVRVNDLWSGASAVELVRIITTEERAHSLQYRLDNEDLLIAKGLLQPWFGWGGWGRNFVYDDWNRQLSIIDGMWMLAFGSFGMVGLLSMVTALLLPAVLFLKRFAVSQWNQPSLAPVAAIAVVIDLCMLDSLFNGMLNVLYIIATGGLMNIVSAKAALPTQPSSAENPLEEQAAHYRDLGRALKDQGRYLEAKTAWSYALEFRTKLVSAQPNLPLLRRQWCDCANDLAWLLVTAPDLTVRDPGSALALASQTTAADPECSTYWNTLGAACYRTDQFEAAIEALDRATALTGGGTAFDHFFLAMAHTRMGSEHQANQWNTLAIHWMEQHHPGHPDLVHLRDEAKALA
jgi:tetratricopeptide (TPR) repeat protein